MKLHLGCGKKIKEGYRNIDLYIDDPRVERLNIFDLPIESNSVVEVLSEHLVEHIGFADEQCFWEESFRVLKPGGRMITESPDFEWLCEQFLKAGDTFKAFYQKGSTDHYFGNGMSLNERWGILTTLIFGNQNGEGQFHLNAYTEKKFISIAKLIGFRDCSVSRIVNKHTVALVATMTK